MAKLSVDDLVELKRANLTEKALIAVAAPPAPIHTGTSIVENKLRGTGRSFTRGFTTDPMMIPATPITIRAITRTRLVTMATTGRANRWLRPAMVDITGAANMAEVDATSNLESVCLNDSRKKWERFSKSGGYNSTANGDTQKAVLWRGALGDLRRRGRGFVAAHDLFPS